jgi:AMP nucleosidase
MFHTDAPQALAHVQQLYREQIDHLRAAMQRFVAGETPAAPIHAYYPFVRIKTTTVAQADTKLTYGFVEGPGTYEATLTRPDLFASYFGEQLRLLILHHQVPIEVGLSDKPIPIHFSFADNDHIEGSLSPERRMLMRDVFDLPDLESMDDGIANGTWRAAAGEALPLSLFTAPRVDYSLHRLRHYTGTAPDWFQNFVLFTNYQFYIDEFIRLGHAEMAKEDSEYIAFVEPGNVVTRRAGLPAEAVDELARRRRACRRCRLPPGARRQQRHHHGQHRRGPGQCQDHHRPHRRAAPPCLDDAGPLRGLRNSQQLGDYVLAHAYVREDHVLDEELPLWVPIPALAEIQVALQQAVADVTQMERADLKRIMRTGTVASTDNRNWELLPDNLPQRRFSQSRAVALDMESPPLPPTASASACPMAPCCA